jgi:hypothetical protein
MMSPRKLDAAIIPEPAQERNPADTLLEMGWLLVAILVPLIVNRGRHRRF